MSRPPLVTVLLPVRDAERTVARAVESLLEGTLQRVRVLCVDDGSRDGSRAALEALARQDARVQVLDSGGQGIVAALNLALAHADSPFVARMDADDEALPRRLEASVQALEQDGRLAGVGTGVTLFREDRPVSPSLQAYAAWLNGLTTPERLQRECFIESPLCHPSVCLRREAVVEAGGYAQGDFPEDYALWLTLLARGHRLRTLPEVLLRWRDGDTRLSRTDPRYHLKRFTWLKARHLAPRLRGLRVTVWGAGATGLLLTRLLQAEDVAVTRLVDLHPRKLGTRIHGAPVVHPEALGAPEPGEHLLFSVGAPGAREECRAFLSARGWVEGAHFTCAA
ncbi:MULTISPECIES: glycosyltransferase [Myxococcaceae]|uniref:glycosyltransferase family 2 protein n=1 Tax=Myxococcaceae TaxID=31 RepID=UPI00188FB93C|nr:MULTISPECIES: glycosyltransferase [Myxococcaceae]MBF5041828.1 glycosyltransferase [Simulacricoccus sp. 17bor-14]